MSGFRRRLMMAAQGGAAPMPDYLAFTALEGDKGTIDNPIPYSLNMELVEGKYYIEDDVKYLCTRGIAASYWPLRDLVGQYVEIVN